MTVFFGFTLTDSCSPFGGIPRNWKRCHWDQALKSLVPSNVPPSGGSLEIGNNISDSLDYIPSKLKVPPSGGSLEIGNFVAVVAQFPLTVYGSPFGGIPRNWKLANVPKVSFIF